MIQPQAILQFVDKQKKLLRQIYDEAWLNGVDSYEPDDDPEEEPPTPRELVLAGLVGSALLAALRDYKYVPPASADPVRRAVALYPSYQSLNKMVNELLIVTGGWTPEAVAAKGDLTGALQQWMDSNAWRLAAGDSTAWAGEQAGYAEAANADGQFIYAWMSVGDTHVCSDCELLSSFPPMSLGEWPTSPGAGDTECSVGCRCSWDTFATTDLPITYVPQLTQNQADLANTLADQQAQVLMDLMPDVAYLE